MLTYSRKITLLMVVLAVICSLVLFAITNDTFLSAVVMIMTYVVQVMLVFATGKVGRKSKTNNSLVAEGVHEFGSKGLQELLLANARLLPRDVQQSLKEGNKFRFSVIATK